MNKEIRRPGTLTKEQVDKMVGLSGMTNLEENVFKNINSIPPMGDDEIDKIEKSILNRWQRKKHYQYPDSPRCVMTAVEVLAMISRIKDIK